MLTHITLDSSSLLRYDSFSTFGAHFFFAFGTFFVNKTKNFQKVEHLEKK